MSEHRSILEKLTRLRDQLPTAQLATERAQELLDALNEHWFGKYLDGQQDLLQLVEDYANGQQPDEAMLSKVTRPLTAQEQQLATGRFWMEAGNWDEAAKACIEIDIKFPYLVRTHRGLELQIQLLNAKAMDSCQKSKPIQSQEEELPSEAKKLPKKYQKDKRRWGAGWGL